MKYIHLSFTIHYFLSPPHLLLHPSPLSLPKMDVFHGRRECRHHPSMMEADDDGDADGSFDGDDISGDDVTVAVPGVFDKSRTAHTAGRDKRRSELSIAFEGEVYVFPAVTSDKVQAILLLLGHEPSTSVPTSESLLKKHNMTLGDTSNGKKISHQSASLVRFREKRKERCFDKKIRYTCRKEVAQRMHRKNGQFVSPRDPYKLTASSWNPSNCTPLPECVPRGCQHCGISEKSTPAMRRGPAGPRTLCNACGLMWANKGTLKDLTKSGRNIPFNGELDTPSYIKPLNMERDNLYINQGMQGNPEEANPSASDSEKTSTRENDQDLMENDEAVTNDSAISLQTAPVNEGRVLDEITNDSGTEFDISAGFDEPVGAFYLT